MPTEATFIVDAPAKINIHLEIMGSRPDGYHELRSLFAAVDLADRLHVTIGAPDEGDRLRDLIGGVDDRRNTVVRAVELFRRETGSSRAVAVKVEKRIPLGAGLGGGSSDAAAMLKVLNRAAGFPLTKEALILLGVEIGSDVPFFLAGACAVVEGRGERVLPVRNGPRIAMALVVPDFPVGTAEAYRWLDLEEPDFPHKTLSRDDLIRAFLEETPERWRFFNSFSAVLFERYPLFTRLEAGFRKGGALFSGVSGSGSSYFGVFPGRREAEDCLAEIEGSFRFAGVVETLSGLPPVVPV
ncbi:MAG: 4-(cytidine 5'-diphospho)-2-C-methyl-D-erythritol kinase [Spirochaetales bacterium]|nr:4-(cytidine 5'-diphospho)-2-C-methyl-D-erythritol kinase [Spirochaetales bacterium]